MGGRLGLVGEHGKARHRRQRLECREHSVVRPRRRQQTLVVALQELRERLVERPVDARGRDQAADQLARAIAHHGDNLLARQRGAPVDLEHGIAGVGQVLRRVDERAVEVEDKKCRHQSPENVANDVGVSHTVTRTTLKPACLVWS